MIAFILKSLALNIKLYHSKTQVSHIVGIQKCKYTQISHNFMTTCLILCKSPLRSPLNSKL